MILDSTGSSVVTNGPGDNFQLQYLQDIVEPDDTTNTNKGRQLVSLDAQTGGKIDTSEHEELGFLLEQTLIDIDNHDNQPTARIQATNNAFQTLGIDSDNGAEIQYDTNGLSKISQKIEDCSFSTK